MKKKFKHERNYKEKEVSSVCFIRESLRWVDENFIDLLKELEIIG